MKKLRSVLFRGIIIVSLPVLTGWLESSSFAQQPLPPKPIPEAGQAAQDAPVYETTPEEMIPDADHRFDAFCNGCRCDTYCRSEHGKNYTLTGRAGADYFSVPGATKFGGLYGADFSM